MKLNVVRLNEVPACAAGGIIGALVFLFAFPKGAISTLMHAVLGLPGPGAGIAMVVGPFVILVGLIAALLTRRAGSAAIAGLAFAATQALVPGLLGMASSGSGALGSPLSIVGIALPGVAVEAALALGKGVKSRWRSMVAGALANAVLLGFYGTVVFPRTYKPVAPRDVPLLMGLALAGGLLSGYVAWVACNPLLRTFAVKERQ